MKKKILAFVLAFALIFSMAVSPVYAQTSDVFTVKVNNATATAGDSRVAVGIQLQNNTGIDGFSFCVEFDSSKLVYVDATIDVEGYKVVAQQDADTVNLAWTGTDTLTNDAQIATVYFDVPKDAVAGNANISITYREGYDSFYTSNGSSETDVAVSSVAGKVEISEAADSDNMVLSVGNLSISAENTDIIVPISISNNDGFSGFSFCVDYDTTRLVLDNVEILIAEGYKVISYPDGYGVNIAWTDTTPYTANGEIVKLHFTLKDNVKSGKAFVGISYRNGYDSFYVSSGSNEQDIVVDSFNGYVDVNNHVFGEWYVAEAATCTMTGIKERKCSECGETETAVLPKAAHEYEAVVTPPTCTAQGFTTHICKNCPDFYADTYVSTADHTPGEWETNFDAECLIDGEEIQKCTVCQAVVNRRAITAPGHNFGEWYTETPAQFNVAGTLRRDCSKCDAYETDRIPKLSESHNHSFTGTEEVIEDATCAEDGSKKIYCSTVECGEYITETIKALGHNWNSGVVTKTPDCQNTGEKTFTCSECREIDVRILPKTAHTESEWDIVDEPSCSETGHKEIRCALCDELLHSEDIPATGHNMSTWSIRTQPTETVSGEAYRVCSKCGTEETEEIAPLSVIPKIIVADSNGTKGSYISVAVSLENNPGLVSMTLNVAYDSSAMSLVEVEDLGKIGSAVHSDQYTNPYVLCWANDTATQDYVVNGDIVILTFKIKDTAQAGDYKVSVSYDYDRFGIYNSQVQPIRFFTYEGTISVSDALIGDVNNDGFVDGVDRLTLTRYLANWSGYTADTINMVAADVNADGFVDGVDRLILTRHLANWSGYGQLPHSEG